MYMNIWDVYRFGNMDIDNLDIDKDVNMDMDICIDMDKEGSGFRMREGWIAGCMD